MEIEKTDLDEAESRGILARIEEAFLAAASALAPFRSGAIRADRKADRSPVTEADRAVDAAVRKILLCDREGWLSEETKDNPDRLSKDSVWVVDPIDGTLEFVEGIPEWCVSIGYVRAGRAAVGGIFNPAAGEKILGSIATGVTYNGQPARVAERTSLHGALVLASRSEVKRKEWEGYGESGFEIRPMGSVAYKLALVAAGRADATWTLSPKHEWDVAAGAALVAAAGGFVCTLDFAEPRFNQPSCWLSGLVAGPRPLREKIAASIEPRIVRRPG